MTKPTFENGRIVPATSGRVKSSQGEWTPRTPDAFERTYEHIMRIGVMNCRDTAQAYQDARRRASVANLQRVIAKRKAIRANGGQVTQLDNI